MMVYLFGSRKKSAELKPSFEKMTRMFVRADVEVVSNLKPKALEDAKRAVEEGGGMMLLDRIDAFIIEAGTPDPEIGYILAHAVVYKKSTLVLYSRGSEPRDLLQNFKQKDVEKFLMFKGYNDQNLERLLYDFLAWIDVMPEMDRPTIKYTLRVSPRISRYAEWKAKDLDMSKADFMRALLEGELKEDKSFQEYLKNKGKDVEKNSPSK